MIRELGYKFLQSWALAALQTAQRSPNVSILWEAFVIENYFCKISILSEAFIIEIFFVNISIYCLDLFLWTFVNIFILWEAFVIETYFLRKFPFISQINFWDNFYSGQHLSLRFIFVKFHLMLGIYHSDSFVRNIHYSD